MPNAQVHERLSRISGQHRIAVRRCAGFQRAARPSHGHRHRAGTGCNHDPARGGCERSFAQGLPERLLSDATHHPHISILQRYVRTADLDKVYAAAGKVLADEKVTSWKLKAFKYYYIPWKDIGLGGIVVEPTDDLLRLQQELIDAVAPFTEKTGTAAAYVTTPEDPEINQPTIDYVAAFVPEATGAEVQSARHDRRRTTGLPQRDACRAV